MPLASQPFRVPEGLDEEVTILGFGTFELRGVMAGIGRPLASGEPERILNAVLDAGINYIDVAVEFGEAESHIGRCLAASPSLRHDHGNWGPPHRASAG